MRTRKFHCLAANKNKSPSQTKDKSSKETNINLLKFKAFLKISKRNIFIKLQPLIFFLLSITFIINLNTII